MNQELLDIMEDLEFKFELLAETCDLVTKHFIRIGEIGTVVKDKSMVVHAGMNALEMMKMSAEFKRRLDITTNFCRKNRNDQT